MRREWGLRHCQAAAATRWVSRVGQGRVGWAGPGAAPPARSPSPGLRVGTAEPAEAGADSKWRRSDCRERGTRSSRCSGPLAATRTPLGRAASGAPLRSVPVPAARPHRPRLRPRAPLRCRCSPWRRCPPTAGVPWLGTSPGSPSARIAAKPRLGPRRPPSPACVRQGSLPAPAAPAGHASPLRLWLLAPVPRRLRFHEISAPRTVCRRLCPGAATPASRTALLRELVHFPEALVSCGGVCQLPTPGEVRQTPVLYRCLCPASNRDVFGPTSLLLCLQPTLQFTTSIRTYMHA